jgi:signal transduction histidine kinase/CheY-like chemotaxis protein
MEMVKETQIKNEIKKSFNSFYSKKLFSIGLFILICTAMAASFYLIATFNWQALISIYPKYFSFFDRNLYDVLIFFFLGLFLSFLIYAKLSISRESKKSSYLNLLVLESQVKTSKLKSLNELHLKVSLISDIKTILNEFFIASAKISNSSHAFIYYSKSTDNPENIEFQLSKGFKENELNKFSLSMKDLNSKFNKTINQKSELAKLNILTAFMKSNLTFDDWVLIPLPSSDHSLNGLLFLGRRDKKEYSEIDYEIIESIAIQLGVRIENKKLFKKAEDLNKFNTTFLSNISHEIRTPLNAITGFSEILNLTEDPSEKIKLSNGIKKNTDQLTHILDNILEISKLESGLIQIQKKPHLLASLISLIENNLKMKASIKNLESSIRVSNDLPNCVESDYLRTKQILFNLIDNAIKFTESGVIHILIEYDYNSSTLSFKVIDKGIGISQETQLELFKNFTQLDSSSTRRFGGVGLGLSLSQRIAQQMNGHVILVESILHQGSTFQLKLPCKVMTELECLSCQNEDCLKSKLIPKYVSLDLNHKKVLLVEDSIDNQDIFEFYLKSVGLETEIVDNGEDAVKKALTSYYDFILMDIQLPKMDGLEATRLIRSHGFTKPIIALTAHASFEEKLSCLSAGCVDLITKPVTQKTLIHQIQNILEAQ